MNPPNKPTSQHSCLKGLLVFPASGCDAFRGPRKSLLHPGSVFFRQQCYIFRLLNKLCAVFMSGGKLRNPMGSSFLVLLCGFCSSKTMFSSSCIFDFAACFSEPRRAAQLFLFGVTCSALPAETDLQLQPVL